MHPLAASVNTNTLKFEGGRTMPSSIREMLAEANAAVPRLNPAEVRDMIGKGNVLIVDVRDAPELAAGGKLKGAVNASRGMAEIRADPKIRSVPLVIMSASSEAQHAEAAMAAGANFFMTKPFNLTTLKDVITQLMRPPG